MSDDEYEYGTEAEEIARAWESLHPLRQWFAELEELRCKLQGATSEDARSKAMRARVARRLLKIEKAAFDRWRIVTCASSKFDLERGRERIRDGIKERTRTDRER